MRKKQHATPAPVPPYPQISNPTGPNETDSSQNAHLSVSLETSLFHKEESNHVDVDMSLRMERESSDITTPSELDVLTQKKIQALWADIEAFKQRYCKSLEEEVQRLH
jgi:isochorismate synthase EntC